MKNIKIITILSIFTLFSSSLIVSCAKKEPEIIKEEDENKPGSITNNNSELFLEDSNYFYEILDDNKKELSIYKYKDIKRNSDIFKITIPSSKKLNNIEYKITEIGYKAFYNKQIDILELPDTIEIINEYAFEKNNIVDIKLPSSLISIKDFAFNNNLIESIQLPESLKHIGKYSFSNNKISNIEFAAMNLDINFNNLDLENKDKQTIINEYGNNFLVSLEDFSFYNNKIEDLKVPGYLLYMGCATFIKNPISTVHLYNYQSYYALGSCYPFDANTKIEIK